MGEFLLRRATALPANMHELELEAAQAGFEMMRRLREDWRSGANRFDCPGEALLYACVGERVIGVAGLNVDPYQADDRVGRIRHVYVLSAARGRGAATDLVSRLIAEASGHFQLLRLYTDSAAAFYERLGFTPAQAGHVTHVMPLR